MRTYQMTCLMILLWLALAAVAEEQAETPPMREITSAEITRFLNDPSGAKIEGHLAVIPKTEAGIQGVYERSDDSTDRLFLNNTRLNAIDFERLGRG